MDMKIIEARLQEHLKEAIRENDISDWFVIASNGSMNYGLETENSDIDSKLLVVPSLRQLIDSKRNNYLYVMSDNEEHVEVKDIGIYMKTILKQNINFVETLFAKAVIINAKYKQYWDGLQEHREEIARYDEHKALGCMIGMMRQKRKDMITPTPARQESIDRIGYDAKSFHHLMRLHHFMERYIEGCSYDDCLKRRKRSEHQELINAKLGVYDLDITERWADDMIYNSEIMMDEYSYNEDVDKKIYVERLVNDIVYDIIDNHLCKNYGW